LYPLSSRLQILRDYPLIFASREIHYWNIFLYNHIMAETKNPLQHIAFIMDGNRRWARKLSNIVSFGHESGGDNIDRVLELCLEEGIPYVSMWALSKENILERDT
jgi:undecaprenyl pyrophosphate synthase